MISVVLTLITFLEPIVFLLVSYWLARGSLGAQNPVILVFKSDTPTFLIFLLPRTFAGTRGHFGGSSRFDIFRRKSKIFGEIYSRTMQIAYYGVRLARARGQCFLYTFGKKTRKAPMSLMRARLRNFLQWSIFWFAVNREELLPSLTDNECRRKQRVHSA